MELDYISLPDDIELDTLLGNPTLVEMPVLGGLCDIQVRVFTFSQMGNIFF
jgi:hypothetical protein